MYLVAHKKPNKGLFAIYINIYTQVITGERDLRSVYPTGAS